tara:strand:- start:237 stop:449 length:213 start_codon:yes stop_codon:yes gene_type:complete
VVEEVVTLRPHTELEDLVPILLVDLVVVGKDHQVVLVILVVLVEVMEIQVLNKDRLMIAAVVVEQVLVVQ